MYCRNCGKEIKENTNYCPYCGYAYKKSEDGNKTEGYTEKKDNILQEVDKLSHFSIILLVLSIINIIISVINLGLFAKYITLALAAILTLSSLVFYIKKRIKYDFLSFSISITALILNIGLIVYLNILI